MPNNQVQLIERLHHLRAHNALTLLWHSFSIPKLLCVLCTSPAFQTPLLISWYHLLLSIVSKITGIFHLAPTALLASADGAHLLMLDLLPAHLSTSQYEDRGSALRVWNKDLPPEMPVPTLTSSQKAWDRTRIEILFDTIITSCSDVESRARLLDVGSVESRAWLNAPPVSSLGLRMSDEAIHQDCLHMHCLPPKRCTIVPKVTVPSLSLHNTQVYAVTEFPTVSGMEIGLSPPSDPIQFNSSGMNIHRRLNNTVLFIIMYVQYVQLMYSGNYNFLPIFDENRT